MAGEDLHNWYNEADMIEKISNDVLNKLFTPSVDSDNFVGIEAHLEAMNQMLCLESEEARMVGILRPSGIGKTTIAEALLSQLSSQFHHRAFVSSRRRTNMDHDGMKLYWEQQLLSEILGQKDLKIYHSGMVEQRLKDKKVLIFLDDVDDLELLNTLVGKPGWFGPGSKIIVITQDSQLLKAHEIDLIYEVPFPSKDLALKMLCRSAFVQNSPPPGFMELAVEVAKLAGNLPLGLRVLGLSLKGRDKDGWIEMLPRLRNNLNGKIEEVLRVSYDRLGRRDRELFLYLAFASKYVTDIRDFLEDSVDINTGLNMLAEKSFIRRTGEKNVKMHNLLQSLGREIVRAESISKPGKRRFLEDVDKIVEVLTNKTGTETVLGICLDTSDLNQPLNRHKKAFKGMHNLQFLIICNNWGRKNEVRLYLPQDLAYLPSNLRLLVWYEYSSKCLPSNFKAEFLVELTMMNSKLEKLWEGGTQPLRSLKRMHLRNSRYLKEIPDLSNAINLEELDLYGCESLVTLPSWIQNAIKLRKLNMENCTKLESLPTLRNLESLKMLNLKGCFRLRNFPQVILYWMSWASWLHENEIEVEDCFWNKILHGVEFPRQFRAEHIRHLRVRDSMIEKLWEGVKSLKYLDEMDLLECENLKELPDLSKATNLSSLKLNNCKSLVKVIGNRMTMLEMKGCTRLESVNLSYITILNLSGCKRLRSFPQISRLITDLNLNDTAIEEVPCCIANFLGLTELSMRGCRRLKNISPNIFRLRGLERADFSECVEVVTALGDASVVETAKCHFCFPPLRRRPGLKYFFKFNNCFNLDGDARELILRSFLRLTFLPGGNVPKYFTHRSSRNSLTVTLPQSSLSQEFLRVKACVVLEPITNPKDYAPYLKIRWHFRGVDSWQHRSLRDVELIYNTDHLVLVSLKFPNKAPPSELDYNDVEFDFSDDVYVYERPPYVEFEFSGDDCEPSQYVEFECSDDDYEPSPYVEFEFSVVNDESDDSETSPFQRIKGCGIRVLDVSPSPDGSDGSKKPMR